MDNNFFTAYFLFSFLVRRFIYRSASYSHSKTRIPENPLRIFLLSGFFFCCEKLLVPEKSQMRIILIWRADL